VLVQAAPNPSGAAGDQLLLSSSRSEVLLWRADGFDAGGCVGVCGGGGVRGGYEKWGSRSKVLL